MSDAEKKKDDFEKPEVAKALDALVDMAKDQGMSAEDVIKIASEKGIDGGDALKEKLNEQLAEESSEEEATAVEKADKEDGKEKAVESSKEDEKKADEKPSGEEVAKEQKDKKSPEEAA